MRPDAQLATHEVLNQPPPRADAALWSGDVALREAMARHGGDAAHLAAYAETIGSAAMREAGREASRHPPELRLFDRAGRRLDEVAFHPAYHRLMAAGLEAGYAGGPWREGQGARGGHVTHAAMVYLTSQVEPGVCCPMTMTYAGIPALAGSAEGSALAAEWVPKLAACAYDPSVAPVAEKRAATLGMAMTEKQGGSGVRANATRIDPNGDA